MADEECHSKSHECVGEGEVETKDRGLFDILGKKEEKKLEEVVVCEFDEKVKSEETKPEEEGEKKHSLLEKLPNSDGSSSSSSDEEEDEGKEKKNKKKHRSTKKKIKIKKGLKVKIKRKTRKLKIEEDKHGEYTTLIVEEIKENLPRHKETEEVPPPPPPAEVCSGSQVHSGE
ncbi:hypothetical protein SLE2022_173460 [Rubroshorea leprosula]